MLLNNEKKDDSQQNDDNKQLPIISTDWELVTYLKSGKNEHFQLTTISIINLWTAMVKAEGAKLLANALQRNTLVTDVQIGYNDIGDEGCLAMCEMLKLNKTIKGMKMALNGITIKGGPYVANMLKQNNTLTTLHLTSNDLANEGVITIAQALSKNNDNNANTTLTNLHLSSNEIGDEGAIALAEMLKSNSSLTSLILKDNLIGVKGAVALAHSLENHNNTLSNLNLYDCKVAAEGIVAMGLMLPSNKSIETLNLSSPQYINSSLSAKEISTIRDTFNGTVAKNKVVLDITLPRQVVCNFSSHLSRNARIKSRKWSVELHAKKPTKFKKCLFHLWCNIYFVLPLEMSYEIAQCLLLAFSFNF